MYDVCRHHTFWWRLPSQATNDLRPLWGGGTQVMYYGYIMTDGSFHNVRIAKGGTSLPPFLSASA